jgi:hypothetical protein
VTRAGKDSPGARRLRAALARLYASGRPPLPGLPLRPVPESEWEHAAEARLGRIEQQLANQNRLLLFTIISIVADLIFGFARQ